MVRLPLFVAIWSSCAACATAGVDKETDMAPEANISAAITAAAPRMRICFTIFLQVSTSRGEPGALSGESERIIGWLQAPWLCFWIRRFGALFRCREFLARAVESSRQIRERR